MIHIPAPLVKQFHNDRVHAGSVFLSVGPLRTRAFVHRRNRGGVPCRRTVGRWQGCLRLPTKAPRTKRQTQSQLHTEASGKSWAGFSLRRDFRGCSRNIANAVPGSHQALPKNKAASGTKSQRWAFNLNGDKIPLEYKCNPSLPNPRKSLLSPH